MALRGYASTRSSLTPHTRTGSAGGCYRRQDVLHSISTLPLSLGVRLFSSGRNMHISGLPEVIFYGSGEAPPGVEVSELGSSLDDTLATPVGFRRLLVLERERRPPSANQFNNKGCLAKCLSILLSTSPFHLLSVPFVQVQVKLIHHHYCEATSQRCNGLRVSAYLHCAIRAAHS